MANNEEPVLAQPPFPLYDPVEENYDDMPPIRAPDAAYDSRLVKAARIGDLAEVKRLLAEGVDPTLNHNAAIFEATSYNRPDVVLELLKDARVDPTEHFDDPEYPYDPDMYNGLFLTWVQKGNKEVVSALLQNKFMKPENYRKENYLEVIENKEMLDLLKSNSRLTAKLSGGKRKSRKSRKSRKNSNSKSRKFCRKNRKSRSNRK